MNKLATINEQEAQAAVYAALQAKGVEITKKDLDTILDTMKDLAIAGIVAKKGIKFRGLGTLEIREHAERPFRVPDANNKGEFITGTTPAGYHVEFVEADSLLASLNEEVKA